MDMEHIEHIKLRLLTDYTSVY